MKFIKILALALVFIAATANSVSAQSSTEQTVSSTETIVIKVNGADCSNDLRRISSNIEKEYGVSSSKVVKEGTTSRFEVTYDPALVTKETIYAAIEQTSGCGNPNNRPYTVRN